MKKAVSVILAAVFVLSFWAFASADIVTKFYGVNWLRYDYNAIGGSYSNATGSNNEFTVPRTYLRWKMSDDDSGIEGNITLDINNVNNGQVVNTTAVTYTSTNVAGAIDWAIWVKKASVDFKKIPLLSNIDAIIRVGQQDVYFGEIDTWSYPVIEKALEDKNGVVSSADNGVSLVGKIPQGFGEYQLAVYNGTGYKDVPNDGTSKGPNTTDKAYDACVLITPIAGLYARASYFHKMTSVFGATSMGYDATALVLGGATGPIEAFAEYVDLVNAANFKAGSQSGVSCGYSGYLGIKLTDFLQLVGRVDTYNPDTRVVRDDRNMYTAGVNLKLSDKVTLQLDYQLDALKFPGTGANDNNMKNNNQWLAQTVWNW